MAIYLSWDDCLVKGTVTSSGYENWVALDSVHYSNSRPSYTESGIGAEGRHVDQPYTQEVLLTKKFDRASPGLMNFLLKSIMGKDVKIAFLDQGDGEKPPVLRKMLTLVEVFVTGYGAGLTGGGGSESLTFSYGIMTVEFTDIDAGGKDNKVRMSWNSGEGVAE